MVFTGLIRVRGIIRWASLARTRLFVDLLPSAALSYVDLCAIRLGDSVAVDGICLTVVAVDDDVPDGGRTLGFDIHEETLGRTTLQFLEPDEPQRAHVELAMPASGRLDGHLVLGHVHGVAHVIHARGEGTGGARITVRLPPGLGPVADKAAVALQGVSLTAVRTPDMPAHVFEVALVPHTLAHTSFGALVGRLVAQPNGEGAEPVNIELDTRAELAMEAAGSFSRVQVLGLLARVLRVSPDVPDLDAALDHLMQPQEATETSVEEKEEKKRPVLVEECLDLGMAAALAAARRAAREAPPEPPVGAALVDLVTGELVATGSTGPKGVPHAEVACLAAVPEALLPRLASKDPAEPGFLLCTTLEPCHHRHKGGPEVPCVEAITAHPGIRHVVYAMDDPDERERGAGAEALRAAGVAQVDGLPPGTPERLETEHFLRAHVKHRVTQGRVPFVTVLVGMAADGHALPLGAMGQAVRDMVTAAVADAQCLAGPDWALFDGTHMPALVRTPGLAWTVAAMGTGATLASAERHHVSRVVETAVTPEAFVDALGQASAKGGCVHVVVLATPKLLKHLVARRLIDELWVFRSTALSRGDPWPALGVYTLYGGDLRLRALGRKPLSDYEHCEGYEVGWSRPEAASAPAPAVLVDGATAAARYAQGELVVVCDDTDRENECDLIGDARTLHEGQMAEMIRSTTGIICAALWPERAAALGLPLQAPPEERQKDPLRTAFTLSVDSTACGTGVSAADRLLTVMCLQKGGPESLRRGTGHVFPLIAHAGGLAARRGHTEAAATLARYAPPERPDARAMGDPVAVLAELRTKDGLGLMRRPKALRWAAKRGLCVTTVEALAQWQAGLPVVEEKKEAAPVRLKRKPRVVEPGEVANLASVWPDDRRLYTLAEAAERLKGMEEQPQKKEETAPAVASIARPSAGNIYAMELEPSDPLAQQILRERAHEGVPAPSIAARSAYEDTGRLPDVFARTPGPVVTRDDYRRMLGLSAPTPADRLYTLGQAHAVLHEAQAHPGLLPGEYIVPPPVSLANLDCKLDEVLRKLGAQAPAEVDDARELARCALPLASDPGWQYVCFGARDAPHRALVLGRIAQPPEADDDPVTGEEDTVLVRVHSDCLWGETLGAVDCDCGAQLHAAMARIAAAGAGVIVFVARHEGRGIGLVGKVEARAVAQECADWDSVDSYLANELAGHPADARDFKPAAAILRALGVRRVHLLTRNPSKVEALGLAREGGLVHSVSALDVGETPANARYLKRKHARYASQSPLLGRRPAAEPEGKDGAGKL